MCLGCEKVGQVGRTLEPNLPYAVMRREDGEDMGCLMGDTVSQQPKLIVSEEQAISVLKIQL